MKNKNAKPQTQTLTKSVTNWSRFSEWVHCMCVVTFDLELGQAIEVIYPENFAPSEQEKTNICYLAFPDSHSACIGDVQFHIKLRLAPDSDCQHLDNMRNNSTSSLSVEHKSFNSQCNALQKADKSHYWGFVFSRQQKESSLPRGYFQKSFIILTRLPFFKLFNEIIFQLAPMYFLHGLSVVQSACLQIASWPPLTTDKLLKLPFFQTSFQTIITQEYSKRGISYCNSSTLNNSTNLVPITDNLNRSSESQYQQNHSPGNVESLLKIKNIASVNEIDGFLSLSCVICNVFTLWELVLTAEPIVVIGLSPAETSHMVQSLVFLIAPFEYCGEVRPYFTIHDSEFKEFTQDQSQNSTTFSAGIIIGVTNPFIVKLLKGWPNIIRIPMKKSYHSSSNFSTLETHAAKTSNFSYSTSDFHERITSTDNGEIIITKYKPFLKKDKSLIKKIVLGINTKRPEHVQSALLRRNFVELTQSFMIPLERYMASLMPLQRDISPFKSTPSPNQFKKEEFLETLEISGPHLTCSLKGNWKGLYQRFLKSSNFKGWYETRSRELQQELQIIQMQALSEADLTQWSQGKKEVEIIDMIIKLKQKLNIFSINQDNKNSCLLFDHKKINVGTTKQLTETRKKLLFQIEKMKQFLPDDLKTMLLTTWKLG